MKEWAEVFEAYLNAKRLVKAVEDLLPEFTERVLAEDPQVDVIFNLLGSLSSNYDNLCEYEAEKHS